MQGAVCVPYPVQELIEKMRHAVFVDGAHIMDRDPATVEILPLALIDGANAEHAHISRIDRGRTARDDSTVYPCRPASARTKSGSCSDTRSAPMRLSLSTT